MRVAIYVFALLSVLGSMFFGFERHFRLQRVQAKVSTLTSEKDQAITNSLRLERELEQARVVQPNALPSDLTATGDTSELTTDDIGLQISPVVTTNERGKKT